MQRHHMRRWRAVTAGVGALLVATGMSLVGAAPASADDLGGVNCAFGSQHQDNHPGLTLAPQDTHIKLTGSVGGCVDPLRPGRVSARFEGTGDGLASCAIGQLVTLVTYRWNDGGTSKVLFGSGVDLTPLGESVVVVNGEVVAGDDLGHQVVKHIALLSTDPLKCGTDEGVREVSGSTDLEVLPL